MKSKLLKYLLGYLFLNVIFSGVTQNLEKIVSKDAFKLGGGLHLNGIYYASDGIEPRRRDPFTSYLSGSISLSYAEFSMPVSFMYSNQQVSYQQPFNQFTLNPTYKNIKGYVGYSNMVFSPYTLNGHVFYGGGVEVTKLGNFSIAAMYGRLQQAVEYDSTRSENVPMYERMGGGLKLAYEVGGDKIVWSFFKANDAVSSIVSTPDSLGLAPKENVVTSLMFQKTISKLVLSFEYATSGITQDTRASEVESTHLLAGSGGLFTNRVTTVYYNAMKGSVKYNFGKITLGANYERIDPGYNTLGSYYFNNDIENISGSVQTKLFKNKVGLKVNLGVQKNNLDNSKMSTMKRMLGSTALTCQVSKKLNFNFNYSNFTTFTNIRSDFQDINNTNPYQNLDTLNFTQISHTAGVNGNYKLKADKERSQMLLFFVTYQRADDKQGEGNLNKGSEFYNGNLTFNNAWLKKGTSLALTVNYNQNNTLVNTIRTFGPIMSLNQSLFKKKFKTGLSVSYNNSYIDSALSDAYMNYRWRNSYQLKKKHSFMLSLVVLNKMKSSNASVAQDFSEYTVNFGYGVRI